MIQLHSLKPKAGAVQRSKARVGRGNASGRGTFCSRGCKGQGQHNGKPRPGFEGGQTPLMRRLPKLKGFRSPLKKTFQIVNLKDLHGKYQDGDEVSFESLLRHRIVRISTLPVKILAAGTLDKKLTFKIHQVSRAARAKIVAAGGKVL